MIGGYCGAENKTNPGSFVIGWTAEPDNSHFVMVAGTGNMACPDCFAVIKLGSKLTEARRLA